MTHLVFGQPIRQPVHLHSDGRKRSHLRCDTRLPRGPGIRRQTTTSAFPISIPAHLLTTTSLPASVHPTLFRRWGPVGSPQ